MNDAPYKNREIDAHMKEIRTMFTAHAADDHKNFTAIRESIDELTQEVKKTNGSVKSLQVWRAYITGGMTVISLIFIPLFVYVLQSKI